RLCWGVYIAPGIDEEFGVRAYSYLMGTFAGGNTGQTSAIEFDAIRLWRDGAVFGGGKIEEPSSFIKAVERTHFPAAIRYLTQQLPVGAVVIKMVPTGAFTLPQKRTVL